MRELLFYTFSFFLLLNIYQPKAHSQATFGEVYKILQTNCLGCHEGDSPEGQLDFSGTEDEVYAAIFETDPTNPFAKNQAYKTVDAGYPNRSTLYRKINDQLYPESILNPAEGNIMPPYGVGNVSDTDKELIRQWIYFGAPKAGKVVNLNTIKDYYADGGLPKIVRPAPPTDGFQLHLGTIFLSPTEEKEFILKYELNNDEALEINKIEVVMNQQSHHFLFFNYEDNAAQNQKEGLQEVTVISTITGEAVALTSDTKMIGGWAYDQAYELPQKTAYRWPAEADLKLNYHIKNYSNTDILPADVYINVHTQPYGTAKYEMLSDFRLAPPQDLIIPPGEKSFDWHMRNFEGANGSKNVHFWLLGAHTHKYGTDFDIYRSDAGGSMGEQVYEGFYNFDYSFNQGYYDSAEPPILIKDDFLTVKNNEGFLVQGTYNNTSSSLVTFGLTTNEEMLGTFMQYIVADDISEIINNEPTDIEDLDNQALNAGFNIQPNPLQQVATINYRLEKTEKVSLKVFNTIGQQVATILNNEWQNTGNHQLTFDAESQNLPNGIYMIQLQVADKVTTQKVVITQ